MTLFLRIVSIDMYGYNGREYHPQPSDVGLIVRPVKMDTMVVHDHGCGDEVLEGSRGYETVHPAALPHLPYDARNVINEDGDGIETCFTCVTADGRLLELMDFEVEPVTE